VKTILVEKYLFISISFYLFIEILCAKNFVCHILAQWIPRYLLLCFYEQIRDEPKKRNLWKTTGIFFSRQKPENCPLISLTSFFLPEVFLSLKIRKHNWLIWCQMKDFSQIFFLKIKHFYVKLFLSIVL